jgi:hypothetical protein
MTGPRARLAAAGGIMIRMIGTTGRTQGEVGDVAYR